jgi:hypothetical protein
MVKSFSSVVSAIRVDAVGREGGECSSWCSCLERDVL